MREFPEVDPLTIEQHPNFIAKIPDDRRDGESYFVLIIDNHLILATTYFHPTFNKWLHYQIEFPKQGLQWFLDTLRDKFFKTEAEGGLPKGKFSDKTTINGERMKLSRAFNADGKGGGGYSFYTLDRKKYDLAKEFTFTDALLFEHGMIKMFQEVADKIAAGEL